MIGFFSSNMDRIYAVIHIHLNKKYPLRTGMTPYQEFEGDEWE